MPYHLRYTPYELSSANITNFCDKYDRYIVAHERHKKDGTTPAEPHYHIWIDSDLNIDSIRTAWKKSMCIPTGGQGRNNKYYSLEVYRNGEDVTYITKQGDIRASKGFDEEQLRPREYPCPVKETLKEKIQITAASVPQRKEKYNMWSEIFAEGIIWEKTHKKKIEVEEALGIITKIIIKKLAPLPHPSDRKRWSQSLVMYSKLNLLKGEVPENLEETIEENTARFMADHFVSNRSA